MKALFFANTDWYLYNFRRSLAVELRDRGHEVVMVSPSGAYGKQLENMGFRWIPAPMHRRSLNPLRELALIAWLTQLVRQERVDLLHGFTIKCAVYGSLAARMGGAPARVSAVAGMGYVFTSNESKARVLRPLVRLLMRFALDGRGARLILQNPDDRALFVDASLMAPERIRIIAGSGVDTSRFYPPPPADAQEVGERDFRVVLPARVLWDKGVAEFVEAARILRDQGRAVQCLLAGDCDEGNPASVPAAVIDKWVDAGLVQWLGHVSDMPALFRSVDVVALPSYREGLPKGLIEAAASGLPLVTTDVPGCREVVSHECDGLLVPVKNAAALAGAIARLQDDRELRVRLGAAAREKALSQFDERSVIARTIDVYRELLPDRFAPAIVS